MCILSMWKMGRVYQTIRKMPTMSTDEVLQQRVPKERLGLSSPLVCCCHTVALDISKIEFIRMPIWHLSGLIIIMSSSGSFFRSSHGVLFFDTSQTATNLRLFFLGTARSNDGRTNWSSDRSERISFVKPTLTRLRLRMPSFAAVDFP